MYLSVEFGSECVWLEFGLRAMFVELLPTCGGGNVYDCALHGWLVF